VERRRAGRSDQTPMEVLRGIPATVALDRIPVPIVAVSKDGSLVYANDAFAAMVGHTRQTVLSLMVPQIFEDLPAGHCAICMVRDNADRVVCLRTADNFTVRARMSQSALIRRHDPIALTMFHDLTEQIWTDGRELRVAPARP
jgi:PAS domain S-box-containing protein